MCKVGLIMLYINHSAVILKWSDQHIFLDVIHIVINQIDHTGFKAAEGRFSYVK